MSATPSTAIQVVLGIDIGTSACKALLFDERGRILARHDSGYDIEQPRPGWTQQDPQLWLDAARQSVAAVLAQAPHRHIAAIGLTGQMHGMVPLDASDQVIRPAMLWNDQRSECVALTEQAGGEAQLRRETNNPMLPGYTGGKIAWMRKHEPAHFARLKTVLNPKDWLRLMLTGEKATEVSEASGTGLFDVRARRWATSLIERLDMNPAWFAPCYESTHISARVSRSGAALFGLPEGVPVVGGGGDSVIQTLGCGVAEAGQVQTTIGTAGITACALSHPVDNPTGSLQVFCNVLPSQWHMMGVSMNAGFAMQWLRRLLRSSNTQDAAWDYETIVAHASRSVPGSQGLIFLPYLNGERAPHSDPLARAAFIGLSALHDSRDMARAVMEGITFALYDVYTAMQTAGVQTQTTQMASPILKTCGGGVRAQLWRQMQADVFGCEVVTTEGTAEGAAFGAALVAALGIGMFAAPAEAIQHCRVLTRETPDAHTQQILRARFEVYQSLYPVLRPALHQLAQSVESETSE